MSVDSVGSADALAPQAPVSRRWPWAALIALVLALAGAGVAIVLVREHLTTMFGDLAGGLFCGGGGGRFDCGRVAASDAAELLGYPVAMWGLLFYAAAATLALGAAFLAPAQRAAAAAIGVLLALA